MEGMEDTDFLQWLRGPPDAAVHAQVRQEGWRSCPLCAHALAVKAHSLLHGGKKVDATHHHHSDPSWIPEFLD